MHWSDVLLRLGLSAGRIGLYGTWQVNKTIALYEALKADLAQYEFVVEAENTLIEEAMLTKDADEIARMKVGGGAYQRRDADRLGLHLGLAARWRLPCG